MKAITTTFAIVALAMLGAAPQADANTHHSSQVYISGYRSCGTPIYSERYFIGYDHCGNPVWGERLVREECRPVVREQYIAPCPQPYRDDDRRSYYERPSCGGGIFIQGFFGR